MFVEQPNVLVSRIRVKSRFGAINLMMEINERHTLLRDKLNSFGFTQPLPFGSLAIVSALLDELILANKNVKDAKNTIKAFEKVTLIVDNNKKSKNICIYMKIYYVYT